MLGLLFRRVTGWFRRLSEPSGTAVIVQRVTVPRGIGNAQPQSDREIRPIVEALRAMDEKLDLVWNPKQHMLTPGSYSETGKLIPPEYDGRWNVIRHQTENLHPERGDYAVICVLSEPRRQDGILYLTKDGPYAPVGEWVLELMRSADAQNQRTFKALRHKLWAQHDQLHENDAKINEAEAREGLDRVLHKVNYAGGVGKYAGKGADFSGPQQSLIITP